jgi:hypothetical protein
LGTHIEVSRSCRAGGRTTMAAILGLMFLYVVFQAMLLGVSVAIGFLLQWFIPNMSIGAGVLVGMLSTVASAHFFMQIMRFASTHVIEKIDSGDLDEDEDEAMPELHMALPPLMKRRRRRSKRC